MACEIGIDHLRDHILQRDARAPVQLLVRLGGIAEQEAAIQISNVMLVCGTCGPTRVGHKFEGNTKVRVCKKCGQTLAAKKK